MASALDYFSPTVRRPLSLGEAAGMMVTNSAIGFGGSSLLGWVYGKHSDKWWGKYSPEIAAGAGKFLEGIFTIFFGPGWFSGLAGSVGQLGLNAMGLEVGLKQAQKELGIVMAKVPAGSVVKRGDALPAGSTVMGGLPAAVDGRGLAWDHIQELQSMH